MDPQAQEIGHKYQCPFSIKIKRRFLLKFCVAIYFVALDLGLYNLSVFPV